MAAAPPDPYGAFGPVFRTGPEGAGGPGWYLVLLNLHEKAAEAVAVVADCYVNSRDPRREVRDLLLSPEGWRPQLVGCTAALCADRPHRHLDDVLAALTQPSWVSPQLVVTASLIAPTEWIESVSVAIEAVCDPKAAAAVVALAGRVPLPSLEPLAAADGEDGAMIATSWRRTLTAAFDDAKLRRSW